MQISKLSSSHANLLCFVVIFQINIHTDIYFLNLIWRTAQQCPRLRENRVTCINRGPDWKLNPRLVHSPYLIQEAVQISSHMSGPAGIVGRVIFIQPVFYLFIFFVHVRR